MTLSLIIVSYNTKTLLKACLSSIMTQLESGVEVIVIDNASNDGSPEMVETEFPDVILIRAQENLGYAKANNQGIKRSRGKYLWLLNSDTELPPGVVKQMISAMDTHPHVGIGSPKLIYPGGKHQSNGGGLPNAWRIFTWLFFLDKLPFSGLWQPYHSAPKRHTGTQYQGWVSGAAWCIRKECVNAIGVLDESTFMYTEDVEWCMRAHGAGYKVAEFGAFAVIHHGHASGSQLSALKNEMIHLPKVIKAHNRDSGLTMVLFSLGRRFRWLLFARILFNEQRAAVYE